MTSPVAWLIEEYDSKGQLISSTLSRFEPLELTWFNDLKSKMHNVTVTPLIADTKNAIKVTNTKKYDSKRLTEANGGL
ncbi:hypothetical protein EB001_25095 [bacterium]|nr:hypothetical protein [bacterium]